MADIDLSVAEPTVIITEARTPFLYDLQRLIFDSPVITEAIFVGLRTLTNDIILSRFDSAAIVEAVTIHPERRISVSDNVTVVNEVTNLGSFAQGFVKEIFVIDPDTVMINEFASAGGQSIDRFDTSTITEVVSLTFQVDLSISVSDTATATEALFTQHDASELNLSVDDDIAVISEFADRTWAQPPTFRYVDLVNGSDANNGLTWAKAKKTLGAFSGLTTSDIIKIAKTDDPILITNDALWSDNSPFVGIPSGIVKLVDDGGEDELWNAAPNVTVSADTSTFKSGARAIVITPQGAFTTGKAAWTRINPRNPQTLDLSMFTKLTFNFKSGGTNGPNQFKICLCSDYDGDVIVDSFTIPYDTAGSRYYPFQLARDGGGPLGSAIRSVALYWLIDPGVTPTTLDTIYACNDLGLGSLIGRNIKHPTDPFKSDLMWWTIRHFDMNGTRICLGPPDQTGAVTASTATTCHRFQKMTDRGEADVVSSTAVIADYGPLYARKPFIKVQSSGGQTLEGIGTAATFSGGWNKITGEQDGETFWDNLSGFNGGLNIGAFTCVFEKMGFVRCSVNWNTASMPVLGSKFIDIWSVCAVSQNFGSSFSPGVYSLFRRVWSSGRNISISPLLTTFEHFFAAYSNDSGQSLLVATSGLTWYRKCKFLGHAQNTSLLQCSSGSVVEDTWFIRAPGGSCWIPGNSDNIKFYRCLFESLGGNGIRMTTSWDLRFVDCVFRNNGVADIGGFSSQPGYRKLKLVNTKLLSTNRVLIGLDNQQIDQDSHLQWQKEEMVEKAHKRLMVFGTIQNDLVNYRTQPPCISMLSNTNALLNSGFPSFMNEYWLQEWNIGKLVQKFSAPVTKGQSRTLSIYMKAEPGFNGDVWLSAEVETEHVVKAVKISPPLTQDYQQYSVVVPAVEIDDDGVVQLVVATEKDSLHKIFLDDFNWA